jgi:hypothetical protein
MELIIAPLTEGWTAEDGAGDGAPVGPARYPGRCPKALLS